MLQIADDLKQRMGVWRRDIHQHAEIAFQEHRTAGLVAKHLNQLGLEVHTGLGGTGVVGVLRSGTSAEAIALRADMDALPMNEATKKPYASINQGCFHGCGHDGHTAMLLGAAEMLSRNTQHFDGTIIFIFQPAEEGEGGAVAMMDDGLFERFPVNNIFGLHNWPELPLGSFAVRRGAMMAAFERFDITLSGRGGHAALPQETVDPILMMSSLAQMLQTIVSRNINPTDPAVVSITKAHAGSAYNIIPQTATLAGGARYFSQTAGALINQRIREISDAIATSYGGKVSVEIEKIFTALVNDDEATDRCVEVARLIAGDDKTDADYAPIMASEDFAYMLERVPGCYILMGTGAGADDPMLHNPHYDFNDDALAIGVKYWCALAQRCLPAA